MATLTVTGKHLGRRLILMSAVAVLAAALQPWLWVWVRAQAVEFHSRRSQAEQLSQLIERVEGTRSALAKQQGFIDALTAVAPQEQGAVRAIESLEQLAAAHGLTLAVHGISDSTSGEGEAGIPQQAPLELVVVSLSTSGGPTQLFAFVEGIERLALMNRLTDLLLELPEPGSEAAAVGHFTLELTAEFFIQRTHGTPIPVP